MSHYPYYQSRLQGKDPDFPVRYLVPVKFNIFLRAMLLLVSGIN